MKTILVLLANEWLIFKNTGFRTRRRTLLTLGLLLAALGAMTGISFAAVGVLRAGFEAFGGATEIVLPLALSGLFLWLMMAAFAAGIQLAAPRFYRSPDLNLLISLPVSAQALFAARFLLTMWKIARTQLFLMLPILVAVGIVVEAQIGFYLLLIPLLLVVCAVPAALSIAIMIGLVRRFSPKRIAQVGGLLGMLSTGLYIAVLINAQDLMPRILAALEGAPPWLLGLFPPGMAAEIHTAAALGDLSGMILPAVRLLAAGAVVTGGALLVVQRLYHGGFARLQEIAPQKKRPATKRPSTKCSTTRRPATKSILSNRSGGTIPLLGRSGNLVAIQWRQALRNHEAAPIALTFLLGLIGYVVAMSLIELPLGPLGSDLIVFGHIGVITILTTMAVGILLLPVSIRALETNPGLIKERYWLHKVAPLSGRALFWSEYLATFLPAVILGSIALTALNVGVGNGMWVGLGSLLVLGGLTAGSQALDHGSTPLMLNVERRSRNTVVGLLPGIIYFVLVLGSLAIGWGGYALLAPLQFMGDLPQWVLYAVTTAFSLAVVVLTIGLSARLGAKQWEKMEM